jgi:hypothetical protein
MMSSIPTSTASNATTRVEFPDLSFTMTHPTPAQPGVSTLNFHPGSAGSIPPHWHETHREHVRVISGYMLITVGTVTKLYGPEDGVADIPPYTIHAMQRGDTAFARRYWGDVKGMKEGWEKEDVVTQEWTTPSDGQKEVFFRNSMSFFMDYFEPVLRRGAGIMDVPDMLVSGVQLLNITSHCDNYGLMVPLALGRAADGRVSWVGKGPTYALHAFALGIAKMSGWQFWKAEYTPIELYSVCKTMC